MIEKISSLEELQSKYSFIHGRKPVKGDLVYVPAQQGVFEVVYADRMYVRIKLENQTMTLPFSHYKLIEQREPEKKQKQNKKK